MKTTGESSIPKFLFLVFLGHPTIDTLYITPIYSFSIAFSPITDLYQTVHVPTRLIIGAQEEAEQFLQIQSKNSS